MNTDYWAMCKNICYEVHKLTWSVSIYVYKAVCAELCSLLLTQNAHAVTTVVSERAVCSHFCQPYILCLKTSQSGR